MSPALVFVATILALLAWKVRKIFSYWEGKGIPHQGFWQYMRVVYEMLTKPLHISVIDDYKKYGRLYGSYQDTDPCLVVGEPDVLREVYIKDFSSFVDRTQVLVGEAVWDRMVLTLRGTEWKNARTIFTAGFTTARLKTMVPKLLRVGSRTADVFVEYADSNEPANICDIFMKSSLDSVAAVAFNADMDSVRDPNNPFIKNYFNIFGGDAGWKIVLYFKMPRLFKLLRLSIITKEYMDNFSVFVKSIIEERMKSKTKVNDQLQLLLDAVVPEATTGEDGGSSENLTTGKHLSTDDVVAQVFILLIGGNDTVASALFCMFYALALYPEYQEKVIEEIDRVVGKEEVTYEKLQFLEYLEAVINETLRVYTPDAFLMRHCTKKTTLQGIELHPGNAIHIPIHAIHMDPDFYDEPLKFKPERFLPENKDTIRPFTFMPFGAGPRNCVGIRQAMIQLKIFTVCIYQKVKFERCSETIDHMELKSGSLVRELRKPIKLRAVRR
ncbi:cytochrome P450 3A24-like isoform X2 [Ornithodoros turicata]|uniref:cytochrome P450 3A24-like isoform X2 n=1 Tax=Ornithodoros turicata TaxID=34597 RepID=UPI003138D91E